MVKPKKIHKSKKVQESKKIQQLLKLSTSYFVLLCAALIFITALVLGGLIVYISVFTKLSTFSLYTIIILLSFLWGLLCSFDIHKHTEDDRQIIIASILAIAPAAILVGIILKILSFASFQLSAITGSGMSGSMSIVSIFNQSIPNSIVTAVLMFLFFNVIFFIEFDKKKEPKVYLWYCLAFVVVLILVIAGTLIPKTVIKQTQSIPSIAPPLPYGIEPVSSHIQQSMVDTVDTYLGQIDSDPARFNEPELEKYLKDNIDENIGDISHLAQLGYDITRVDEIDVVINEFKDAVQVNLVYPVKVEKGDMISNIGGPFTIFLAKKESEIYIDRASSNIQPEFTFLKSSPVKLFENADGFRYCRPTSDGEKIYFIGGNFSKWYDHNRDSYVFDPVLNAYSADLEGDSAANIQTAVRWGSTPMPSPDKTKLAMTLPGGFYILDLKISEKINKTEAELVDIGRNSTEWSEDGKSYYLNGEWIQLQDGLTNIHTAYGEAGAVDSWSNNGRMIALTDWRQGAGDTYLMEILDENGEVYSDIQTRQPKHIDYTGLRAFHVSIHGNKMVYVTVGRGQRMYMQDMNTGEETDLSARIGLRGAPVIPLFSPDGKRIAFVNAFDVPGNYNARNVYIYDLEKNILIKATDTDDRNDWITWSGNDKIIFASTKGFEGISITDDPQIQRSYGSLYIIDVSESNYS
ncbi:hypothetical protein ACFL96_08450 [Thermoproteota archaeon]